MRCAAVSPHVRGVDHDDVEVKVSSVRLRGCTSTVCTKARSKPCTATSGGPTSVPNARARVSVLLEAQVVQPDLRDAALWDDRESLDALRASGPAQAGDRAHRNPLNSPWVVVSGVSASAVRVELEHAEVRVRQTGLPSELVQPAADTTGMRPSHESPHSVSNGPLFLASCRVI